MTLRLYRQKRQFTKTPEPRGKINKVHKKLIFVVQKHHASHLHYDLRLEMEGVLKSWAIPKGPSLNPAEKRLAAHVEDHPLDYASFEGIIPEGEYGAGKVIVWDRGYYEPAEANNSPEKALLSGLEKGDLKFVLHGQKLKGEFVLVQFKKEAKNWLLIKKKDRFAGNRNVLSQEESVKSGKTLAEIGVAKSKTGVSTNLHQLIAMGKKAPLPRAVKPMLAHLATEPFDDPEWIYESKYDGYRAVTQIWDGQVRLYSRNNQEFNSKYPIIVEALAKIPHQAVFDGEIVAIAKNGLPSFQLLQDYSQNSQVTLIYYMFDLLYLDGYDLRQLPLIDRKAILKKIIPRATHFKFSDHIEGQGLKLLALAQKQGLEGIIAKKADSHYLSRRSSTWQKFKNIQVQEAVIGGFTQPRGSREKFGALILGVFNKGNLEYIGHTGTGFDDKKLTMIMQKLKPRIVKKCPFSTLPKANTPAIWVKPEVVVQVKFTEWTKDGLMRHPVYLGQRIDKKPSEVRREVKAK